MSDCEPVRGLLRAYLAGQLADDDRATVEAHLESCGACSALQRIYRATVDMAAWPADEIPLPEGLAETVRQAVRLHNRPDPEAAEAGGEKSGPPL